MRRPFNYREYVAGWRELAADHEIDAITGEPLAATDAGWWKNPNLWVEPGPAHSSVEGAAITSIYAQARAAHYVPEERAPQIKLQSLIDRLNDVLQVNQYVQEVMDNPTALHDLNLRGRHWYEYDLVYDPHAIPLALLHYLRGVEVANLEQVSIRIEVPIKPSERRKGKHWDRWYTYLQSADMIREVAEAA